jgi:capsule assembly protein Wzi
LRVLSGACVALLIAVLVPGAAAVADPWIAPGDARLRHDLELLADAGIVRAPLTTWPVSWAEVARDVGGVAADPARPAWLGAALERVQASARRASRTGSVDGNARISGSGNPMALRRFGQVPREEGEISAGMQYTGHRYAYRLQVTAVADPDDDQSVIPDGSYGAVVLGNWMLHAGYIDRWWGPGWEGSLIYGSNARPIPSITLERNYSDPIEHPWFEWIGRFRFAVTMGRFEDDREDAPNANFFGARLTWKPHQRLEIGVSRSAQWCGDGRPCGVDTFWDLVTGNDNDQPLEEQPGNQMGGFDLRWSVPWIPVAFYAQAIGEDEAGFLPSEYLGLAGIEVTGGFGDRSWRAHLEYADTSCDFQDDEPTFGCAYRNSIYFDGYQYRDRSMGHSLDGDSEQVAGGVMLVNDDGSSWEFALQSAKVNRVSANPVHSVATEATRIRSADLYHRRALLGGELSLAIGYEERESEATGLDEGDVRGLLQWRRDFE